MSPLASVKVGLLHMDQLQSNKVNFTPFWVNYTCGFVSENQTTNTVM